MWVTKFTHSLSPKMNPVQRSACGRRWQTKNIGSRYLNLLWSRSPWMLNVKVAMIAPFWNKHLSAAAALEVKIAYLAVLNPRSAALLHHIRLTFPSHLAVYAQYHTCLNSFCAQELRAVLILRVQTGPFLLLQGDTFLEGIVIFISWWLPFSNSFRPV
jgi:hypothetical protein